MSPWFFLSFSRTSSRCRLATVIRSWKRTFQSESTPTVCITNGRNLVQSNEVMEFIETSLRKFRNMRRDAHYDVIFLSKNKNCFFEVNFCMCVVDTNTFTFSYYTFRPSRLRRLATEVKHWNHALLKMHLLPQFASQMTKTKRNRTRIDGPSKHVPRNFDICVMAPSMTSFW